MPGICRDFHWLHLSAVTADEMRTLELSTMLAQDQGWHGRFMIFSPPPLPMSTDSAFWKCSHALILIQSDRFIKKPYFLLHRGVAIQLLYKQRCDVIGMLNF